MNGLGELIVIVIYLILGISAVLCLLKIIISKKNVVKLFYAGGLILSVYLFISFLTNNIKNHRQSELEYVRTYYLSDYPNCDSCELILKDNNAYTVINDAKILESGNWHYESGGDYWIVYLNDQEEQLGSGRFKYETHKNGFSH